MNSEYTREETFTALKQEYREDAGHSYLIIDPEEELHTEGYFFLMVRENRIPGVVPFTVRCQNGQTLLCYDITNRRSLRSEYERKQMNDSVLAELLGALCSCVETVRGYLLGAQRFLLSSEYVYRNAQSGVLEFLCMPAGPDNTLQQAQLLAEFILQKLDHSDRAAVARGYRFYQEVFAPGCVLSQAARTALLEGCVQETSAASEKTEEYMQDEYHELEGQENEYEGETRRKRSGKSLFPAAGAAVLLALCTAAYLAEYLNVTQYGGLSFLIILCGGFLKRRVLSAQPAKTGRKQRWLDEAGADAEWMAEMRERKRELRRELYREETHSLPKDYSASDTVLLDEWDQKEAFVLQPDEEKYPIIKLSGQNRNVRIGRGGGQADILLDEDTVSRIHARIFFKEEGWFLVDLNSKNGTWADEERLKPQEEKRLEDGDRILFGSVSYTVRSLTEERTELLPG